MNNLFKLFAFSLLLVTPATAFAQQYGSFTDTRDGHVYRTVKIGNQTWMAENMAFKGLPHWSADGDNENDKMYGFLYSWENALKVCPAGWHLPTMTDFEKLLKYVELNRTSQNNFLALAAKSPHWLEAKNEAENDFGFSALPAGRYYGGDYYRFGYYAYFWSATEREGSSHDACRLILGDGYAGVGIDVKNYAFSVRCLKDSP